MGLCPSPYVSVRGVLRLKEEAHGNPTEQSNVFRWERVELNLPGSLLYSPVKPWVSKRRKDATLAADSVSFVDDIRSTGPAEIDARQQASQVMAKEAAHCGIQDAARKRRDVSQTPGAWAGSVVHTTDLSVTIMVEQTKWDKRKVKLQWMSSRLDEGPDVEHKPLERIRGFLNYVMQVYPAMIPYLRGFHGTLDSWRSHWTADGFVKERFMVARTGDNFMCMFQCDLCHFRNIQRRSPSVGSMKDQLLLRCIRRANLDAMWAKESSTVANNTRQVRKLVEKGKELVIEGCSLTCCTKCVWIILTVLIL